MKEEIERRRMEAAEKRMKSMNTSSLDGEELFNPLNPKSPTVKVKADLVPPLGYVWGRQWYRG